MASGRSLSNTGVVGASGVAILSLRHPQVLVPRLVADGPAPGSAIVFAWGRTMRGQVQLPSAGRGVSDHPTQTPPRGTRKMRTLAKIVYEWPGGFI